MEAADAAASFKVHAMSRSPVASSHATPTDTPPTIRSNLPVHRSLEFDLKGLTTGNVHDPRGEVRSPRAGLIVTPGSSFGVASLRSSITSPVGLDRLVAKARSKQTGNSYTGGRVAAGQLCEAQSQGLQLASSGEIEFARPTMLGAPSTDRLINRQ